MTTKGTREEVMKAMVASERTMQRQIAHLSEEDMESKCIGECLSKVGREFAGLGAQLSLGQRFCRIGKLLADLGDELQGVHVRRQAAYRRMGFAVIEGGRGQRQSEDAPEPPRAA